MTPTDAGGRREGSRREGVPGGPAGAAGGDAATGLHAVVDSLAAVARSLSGASRPAGATLGARWAAAVGPAVAAHSEPVRLDGDRLVVLVDDPAWAAQLRYLAPQVLARLAETVPDLAATRLEVRVDGHRSGGGGPAGGGPPTRPR